MVVVQERASTEAYILKLQVPAGTNVRPNAQDNCAANAVVTPAAVVQDTVCSVVVTGVDVAVSISIVFQVPVAVITGVAL